jgi:hypothetical protein
LVRVNKVKVVARLRITITLKTQTLHSATQEECTK